MPPEPLPWDRRELIFREKKHDRGPPYGDALGSNGNSSTFRWRESYHNPRDFPGHSVRRSQSGYGRHHGIGNGYQDISGEDPCSRSEDGEFRGYQAGRYGNGVCRNNNRESGGFFRRSSDSGDISRQNPEYVASQSSAVESSSHPSPRILLNDDKQDASRDDVEHDLKTSQRQDRDLGHTLGSLSWKPLKWNRSGSFSSSSKIQKTESEEKKLEVVSPTGKETSVESPVSSPLSPDEGFSRRKQRLGWGQGLAKYERSKTEVSEDLCPRHPSQSDDASLGIAIPAGSTSPPTPASVTCSSSHGGDDKVFSEVTTNGAATSRSLGDDIRQFLDELSISHEYLDLNSPISLTSKIRCLSEIDDGSRGDSSSIAKLLFVKDIVLRQLEKTESDIDSFECELKKLNGDKQSTSKMDDLDSKKNDGPEDRSLFVDEQTDTTSPKLPISESSQLQGDNVPDVSSPSTAECYQESLPLEDGGGGDSSLADFEEEFESLASSIIDSNQEIAKRASLDLDSRASGYSPALQTSESSDNFSDQEKEVLMKKMIGVRKCNSKFKEQVLSLKYRAILRMWKEDMQIHQIRKQRSRSCKKMEPSRSSNHNGQKTRSHVRIRLPLHGSSSSDPTPEAVEFAGRLLSDSHPRIFRNVLKMPALILDEKEKACSRFLTKNGLVEDPISLEKERPLTNSWSPEERSLFIEMLGLYRKDFSKISSFLDHKTTADCIEFYYKNHKSEDFAKAKKKSQDAPAGNFLGAASSSSSKWKRQVVPRQPYPSSSKVSSEAEQETCAADVLVGIMAVTERRLSSSTAGGGSEDLWSEDGGEDMCSGDWTDEEKSAFISALSSHGRDFAFISRCVGSRSVEQCKIFFSKARKSLALDEILGRASGIDDVDSATCAKPEEDPVEPDPCSLPKRSRSSVEDGLSDEGEVKRRKTSPPSDWPEQSVKLFGKILNQPPSSPEKSTSNFLGLPSCGFTAGVDGSSAMLLGGNGCSNGGEPVAAIKLHYVARAGVLSREEESWRADVGR